MSITSCRLLVAVFAMATTFVAAGCHDARRNPTGPPTPPSVQLSETRSQRATSDALPATVNIVVDADRKIQQQLENALRSVPHRKRRYSIIFVQPDASKDYKLLKIQPDPNKKYSIIVVDPETNQRDPNLTDYFSTVVRDLTEEADDREPMEPVPNEGAAEPSNAAARE